MGDVINLFSDDLKGCTYYEVKGEKHLSLAMRDKSLIVSPLNKNEFEVYLHGETHLYKREELAEFLHVLSVMIDPEDKFKPNLELIGLDY